MKDKEYYKYLAHAMWTGNKIKTEGMEAWERDMKKRNITKLPITVTEKEMDACYDQLSAWIYHNMLTGMLYTLHDKCKFGRKRIREFKEEVDKNINATFDLDYMGEHYVRLEDFAAELNEKYDVGINVNLVAAFQYSHDKKDKNYHMLRTERVIQELREAGYPDAAKFLEAKLD